MRLQRYLLKALAFAALLIVVSCGGSAEPVGESPAPTSYDVRGVVRQVRDLGEGHTQLSIYHEAIPEFVSITGDVIGMKSMTMPFTVADHVDLVNIEAGAKIRFELVVDWSRPDPGLIESVELLAEDTNLDLGSAR